MQRTGSSTGSRCSELTFACSPTCHEAACYLLAPVSCLPAAASMPAANAYVVCLWVRESVRRLS